MTIRDVGEFAFLRRLRARLPDAFHAGQVRLDVGDDCAALALPGTTVLTTDAMIAGVHFRPEWAPFDVLGRKAFAVNASDVAAMGGAPTFALLNLGVPPDTPVEALDAFFDGFLAAARDHRTSLVGGNLSMASQLTIAVTLLGRVASGLVTRAGARPGDDLYVSGTVGDAALGLRLLTNGRSDTVDPAAVHGLTERFLQPTARVSVGCALADRRLATAMIDVSDGLLQDLGHLCEASHAGALVEADRLPLSDAYRTVAGSDYTPALTGGEDYELLFSASRAARLAIRNVAGACALTRIGRVQPQDGGVGVVLPDGVHPAAEFSGFDHFASRAA